MLLLQPIERKRIAVVNNLKIEEYLVNKLNTGFVCVKCKCLTAIAIFFNVLAANHRKFHIKFKRMRLEFHSPISFIH